MDGNELPPSTTTSVPLPRTVYVTNGSETKAVSVADLPVIDWSGSLQLPRNLEDESAGMDEYWVVDFLGRWPARTGPGSADGPDGDA